MAAGFDRQIKELSLRATAYHSKCADLWTTAPPPPHLGAPFLFAFVWQSWSVEQRKSLIETGRAQLEQSISAMLSPAGSAGAPPADKQKMELLMAACTPELYQEELYTELNPMAELLATLWGTPAGSSDSAGKADRAAARRAARASRPKHISPEMSFIDRMPWVWSQPTLSLIDHTLQALDYQVFDAPSDAASRGPKLSPEDNEAYQRDLLLSLRAFWMTYFGLQIFMALSPHFASTEEQLLSAARAQAQREAHAAAAEKSTTSTTTPGAGIPGYKKPIHTFRLEDMPTGAGAAAAAGGGATIEEITDEAEGTAATSAPPVDANTPPQGHPSTYCACCLVTSQAGATSNATAPPASLELKRCARCKSVWYCSVACQKKHFKQHKADCLATAATASSTQAGTAPSLAPSIPVD